MTLSRPTRYALGLTRGSVRAVLALIITLATVAAILATLGQPAIAPGAALLANLDLMVLKDYFEAVKEDRKPVGPVEPVA